MALDKLPAVAVGEVAAGLSNEQRAAALAPEPFVRVVAAAGAGKTETLVRRILYLLSTGVAPGEIAAFTYNVRAAEELQERVYARAEKFLPPQVVRKLGEMFVGTIHSFAAHVLLYHLGYGGFDILDENQETAFLIQRGWDLGIPSGSGYIQRCQEFLQSHEVVCNELIEVDKLLADPDSDPAFGNLVRAYRDLLRELRLLTFGLLIERAVAELSRPGIVLPYRHYIVDEFQDVNPAQEKLLDSLLRLSPRATCFVVGDPRQCIYEWRGSDPGCFDRFEQRYGAATYTIPTNRRSGRAVIDAANALSSCFEEPVLREGMVPADGAGSGLAVWVAHETPEDEACWVARVIREAVASGAAQYRDFAVLLRSVRTSGEPFIRAFNEYGIPYVVGGRVGLFRRPEVAAIARVWVWCADLSWSEGVGTPWESGDAILARCAQLWPGVFPEDLIREFRAEVLAGRHRDLVVANYKMLELLGVAQWDPSQDPAAEVRLANLARFTQIINDFQAAYQRGGRLGKPESRLRAFAWYLLGYAGDAYEERQPDPVPDVDAVFLSTVHQAKGVEWPVVIVPALQAKRFPSARTGQKRNWMLSRHLFDVERYEGTAESERKLFFVACTRARDALVLSRFHRIKNAQRRSPFLVETGLRERPAPEPEDFALPPLRAGRSNNEGLRAFTIADILTYLRCPYQYRLRNLWGFEAELHPDLGFGRSVHHVLRVLADRVRKEGVDPLEILEEVTRQHFYLPFRSRQDTEGIADNVVAALRRYLQAHPDVVHRVVQVEARVEYMADPGQRIVISGRADVLRDAGGDELEVIDFKTGEDPGERAGEAELQVQLYALGLTHTGHRVRRGRVDYVTDNRSAEVPVDDRALTRAGQLAVAAARNIVQRCFMPKPAARVCGQCDVRRVCRWAV